MKTYIPIREDAEYREFYDSYLVTVNNLMETDFLYKTSLTNGQVFFDADEVYGFVNNQAAIRGRNLTITRDYIDNFVIRDFKVYSRALNSLLDININCNLKDYRDGKPHYLYIVLSNKGKYEVYDDMFQSDETKLIFARFIINSQGDSVQFYMMLPFAGSADYIKGNQFYQVTDGLRVKVVNATTKQLTLSNAKIRFSGINFDDTSSPDCQVIDFNGAALPIRYCTWDNNSKVPRVDWISEPVDKLILNKIMSYTSGSVSNVPENSYSIQKLYYDVYEKCIVALYGNKIYATRDEAILAIDSVMSYTLPDGIEYLIPIACIVAQNTTSAISDENFRIINLDYNEQEVLDSDTFTRQQSSEAIQKAREALDMVDGIDEALLNHTGDRTNPHRVKLNQLYNSRGTQVTLDDEYANYSVSALLSKAAENAANLYYSKNGGQISGNVSISGTLSVTGIATFKANVTMEKALTIGGNLSASNGGSYNIGSSSSRFATVYANSINTSGDSTIGGTLTSKTILPNTTTSYNLGNSSYRFNYLYTRHINASGDLSLSGSASISSSLSAASGEFSGTVKANRIEVGNGYLIIGNKAFGLGSTFTPPSGVTEAYTIY